MRGLELDSCFRRNDRKEGRNDRKEGRNDRKEGRNDRKAGMTQAVVVQSAK